MRSNFPKGTDFSSVTEAELDAVADELNDRPRKRMGFANPNEQLAELLCNDRSNPPIPFRDTAPVVEREAGATSPRWALARDEHEASGRTADKRLLAVVAGARVLPGQRAGEIRSGSHRRVCLGFSLAW